MLKADGCNCGGEPFSIENTYVLSYIDEQYLPLLTIPTASGPLPNPSFATQTSTLSSSEQANQTLTPTPIHESSLLPDSVKLAMVLEAASDIRGAERDLREIEILKSRQVEGSGELERESLLLRFRAILRAGG